MNSGERWCMARCAGGAFDKSIINRIMLRFRPIAPKPSTGEAVPGGSAVGNKNLLVSKRRGKRKYVGVGSKRQYKRRKRTCEEERKGGPDEKVVTLQLLPESSERMVSISPASGSPSSLDPTGAVNPDQDPPAWFSLDKAANINAAGLGASDRAAVETRVTVECVTGACMEGGGLGSTDGERRRNLERDTCPGFISDGSNRVEWTNEAYGRMVGQRGETMVRLVTKETLPYREGAFACRVRVEYTSGKEKWSQTVPCDVWRMECGGFAWRLDVKAALSLGR